MNWRLALGLILAVVAALAAWSLRNRDKDSPAVVDSGQRPDYVMHDFELISLDDQGKENVTLRAPLLERNATDQTMVVTAPLFLLPDSQGRPWQLRAKSGWISAKGDELRLKDDVVGNSPEGTAPTRLETTHLNVFPDRNLVRTDAKVTVTRPGSILNGVGFEGNTKTKRFSFKSQVHSRYVPQSAR